MLAPLRNQLNPMRIILASGSPRRQEYIQKLGLNVELCPSQFEEETVNSMNYSSFQDFVEAIAFGKAEEVYERLKNDPKKPDLIISADTVVAFDGKIFGKPKTPEIAYEMLNELKGREHTVYTGCVLKFHDKTVKFTEHTKVYLGKLTEAQIRAYINTKEPLDKAGGYGYLGIGGSLIERIEGDYFTAIGLPLYRLSSEMFKLLNNEIK